LDLISQIVFDVMIENAKDLSAFTNNHPSVYIENSERTQRHKNSANKIAAVETSKLNTFFLILQSHQQILHQFTKELMDKLR